jgi:hypothetical protein
MQPNHTRLQIRQVHPIIRRPALVRSRRSGAPGGGACLVLHARAAQAPIAMPVIRRGCSDPPPHVTGARPPSCSAPPPTNPPHGVGRPAYQTCCRPCEATSHELVGACILLLLGLMGWDRKPCMHLGMVQRTIMHGIAS